MKKANLKNMAISAFAALILVLLPASAKADFLDFQVDEGVVVGSDPITFWADAINGSYSEVLTIDGQGGFSATLIATWSQYLANQGTTPLGQSQLDVAPGPAPLYGMYTIYTATGTITPITATEFRFTTISGSAEIWIDPASDSYGWSLPAVGGTYPTIPTMFVDDLLVLSANNIYFEDNVLRVGVGGFFDIRFFQPVLTPFGNLYWPTLGDVQFLAATVDGDFNTFDPTIARNVYSGGDLSANFTAIPEPSTLVLFGLGLVGTALAVRRKR